MNLSAFAKRIDDTPNLSFMKRLILVIAISCMFCGLVWSILYYSIFGLGLTMALPLLFILIVGSSIGISHLLKDHRVLVYAQLFCITWISALIQWSIGSIGDSGLVISWSFLGPIGALIFFSVRQAVLWMVMFILIVVISVVVDPQLLGERLEISNGERMLFYIMNICTSLTVVFITATWFVKTIQSERIQSEKLRNKIRTLLGQHVSNAVAGELLSREEDYSVTKAYDASIMFLDIRDFTLFADSRAPSEVANFQNVVFSELISIVETNRGIVIQLLGDGIFAVFGVPSKNDTHHIDAVTSAMAMIEKVKHLTEEGKIPEIKLGIGIHSGRVVAGEIGNENRKSYSLAGSNVIIAARIEQINKELKSQVLISDAVFEKIQHLDFRASFKDEWKLKGIAKKVKIYQLA